MASETVSHHGQTPHLNLEFETPTAALFVFCLDDNVNVLEALTEPEGNGSAIIAPESLTDWDSESLGSHVEQNWETIASNTRAFAYLLREMQRRFKLRDRHKKVDGTYHTIRGFTSFKAWFKHATGKSYRAAYYALNSENAKHKPKGGIHSHRLLRLRVSADQYADFQREARQQKVTVEQWALSILNHNQ